MRAVISNRLQFPSNNQGANHPGRQQDTCDQAELAASEIPITADASGTQGDNIMARSKKMNDGRDRAGNKQGSGAKCNHVKLHSKILRICFVGK